MTNERGSRRGDPVDTEPVTVTEALDVLRRQGYTADFELSAGGLLTIDDRALCPVEEAIVERLYRFEGPSDPGDLMIVLGLRAPVSSVRGTLATAYGPAADPALNEHLVRVSERWRS